MEKPKTFEEVLDHFHHDFQRTPTAAEKAAIQANLFNESEYAFIKKENKNVAYCSHCEEEFPVEGRNANHNHHHDVMICPCCGETLLVKHVWRGLKRLYDRGLAYIYRQSVQDPAIVTAMCIHVSRHWHSAEEPSQSGLVTTYTVDSYYVYIPGKGGVQARIPGGCVMDNVSYYQAMGWMREDTWDNFEIIKPGPRTNTYASSWAGGAYWAPLLAQHRSLRGKLCNWKGLKVFVDKEGLLEAARESPLRYGLAEYLPYQEDACLRFLDWSARYPSMEMLVKMGAGSLVADRMSQPRAPGWAAINWRGKTIEKIFGQKLTKKDKAYLLKNGISQYDIAIWHDFKGLFDLEEIVTIGKHMSSFKEISTAIDLRKAYDWLKRKGQLKKLGTYIDYILDCVRLEMNLKSKSVLHPKDIDKAHAHTIEQVKYMETVEHDEALRMRGRILAKKYSFMAMGLMIVIPQSSKDFINEGKAMHNCVGGYVDRVASGKTNVVFVRDESKPDESYITMEISNTGYIIQARTQYNGPLDDKGKAFVEAFRKARLPISLAAPKIA